MAREYPEHPQPSCHALVRSGDRVLLVRRARPPLEGYWGLPGGGVELGETVEDAVVREVKEETGLDVNVRRYLGYKDAIERDGAGRVRWHYVIHFFEAAVPEGAGLTPTPSDDAAEARWFTPEELHDLPCTDSVALVLSWSRGSQQKED